MRISDWSSDVCSSDLKAHDRSTKSFLPAGAADADNSRGLATKAGNMLRIYDADAVLTISKFIVEEDERDVVEPRVDVSVRVAKLAFYRLQSEEIRRRFRLVGLYTPLPGVLLPSQVTNRDCKIVNELARKSTSLNYSQ